MISKSRIFGTNTSSLNGTNSQTAGAKADTSDIEAESTVWWASDYMDMLGCSPVTSISNPINRAIQACLSAGVRPQNHFVETTRDLKGHTFTDFRLTRYACYLIAMNVDE